MGIFVWSVSICWTRGLIQASKEWGGPLMLNETVRSDGVINRIG